MNPNFLVRIFVYRQGQDNIESRYFINKIIKDRTFVSTKADCALKKLLDQTGYFKEVMDAFTNNNSEYKLKFEVKPVEEHGSDAHTSGPDENGIIAIRISPGAAQENVLHIAQNLLHEGVHAQLLGIVASGNKVRYNSNEE